MQARIAIDPAALPTGAPTIAVHQHIENVFLPYAHDSRRWVNSSHDHLRRDSGDECGEYGRGAPAVQTRGAGSAASGAAGALPDQHATRILVDNLR